MQENKYVNGEIEIKLLKEDERSVKSLTHTQIRKLLSAFKPYQTMRMRILLALGTGLRGGVGHKTQPCTYISKDSSFYTKFIHNAF